MGYLGLIQRGDVGGGGLGCVRRAGAGIQLT